MVERLFAASHPAYLRLGLSEEPADVAVPALRRLAAGSMDGPGWVVAGGRPLAGGIWEAVRQLDEARRPTLWLLSELPARPIPEEFLADLARSRRLLVVEEHVAQGGVGQMLAGALLAARPWPRRGSPSRSAQGYPSGRYGSQKFHRRECGLDPASIVEFLTAEDG